MKKALGFLKSNIMIFIGALLLLLFMNYLALGGTTLAIGIFATLIALLLHCNRCFRYHSW